MLTGKPTLMEHGVVARTYLIKLDERFRYAETIRRDVTVPSYVEPEKWARNRRKGDPKMYRETLLGRNSIGLHYDIIVDLDKDKPALMRLIAELYNVNSSANMLKWGVLDGPNPYGEMLVTEATIG